MATACPGRYVNTRHIVEPGALSHGRGVHDGFAVLLVIPYQALMAIRGKEAEAFYIDTAVSVRDIKHLSGKKEGTLHMALLFSSW